MSIIDMISYKYMGYIYVTDYFKYQGARVCEYQSKFLSVCKILSKIVARETLYRGYYL